MYVFVALACKYIVVFVRAAWFDTHFEHLFLFDGFLTLAILAAVLLIHYLACSSAF